MRNYDFHELLSPLEFQQFAASILRIRENKSVKSNVMTKDNGIDLYFLDDKVIGQVKNYKNSASKVVSSLKKEVERVKKMKPERYIVVTSAVIDKNRRDILLSMFLGYLKNDDIIDKDDLNLLLEDPKYHKLEIEYLKLLVPNSFVLSHYLDKVQNNKIYTRTEIELNKIKMDKQIFSTNEIFEKSLEKLLTNKTIIISGEAGIGKSILGRMLSSYLINMNSDIEFFSVANLDELFQIYKSNSSQVYFFDDFWGDTKYNFMITDKEKESLFDFIKLIEKAHDKWLIITSREYILKDGIQFNKKLQDKYPLYKFTIDLSETSLTSKFNILFKHICNNDLSWVHLKIILNNWNDIVDNEYYNPRYLETFFNNYNSYADLNPYDFLDKLIDYMDSPFEFWKDILNKQPQEVIILLMVIALNNDGVNIQELNKKYTDLIISNREMKSTAIEFKDIIKRIEDDFTITQIIDDSLMIKFRNPSYKDFLYDFLENNMMFYVSYIYNENLTINELINLWGLLNKNFKLFKNLEEVKKVDDSILDKIDAMSVDDKYSLLLELADVTEFGNNTRVEKYLIQFVVNSIVDIESIIWTNSRHYELVFSLLKELFDKYDFSKLIYDLLYDVTFDTEELFYFEKIVDIKKLYPGIYREFYKQFGTDIRDVLYSSIMNDAYYYKKRLELDGLEYLYDVEMPQIYSDLEIKVPKRLITSLENIINDLIKDRRSANNDITLSETPRNKKEEEDLTLINENIKELIGDNEYVYFDDELKRLGTPLELRKKILKINNDFILNDLTYYRTTINLLCQFLKDNDYDKDAIKFLSDFEDYLVSINDFSENEFLQVCYLSFSLIREEKAIFKKQDLENNSNISYDTLENVDKILNSSFFIKRGEWYHFIHPIIQIHLVLRTLKKINASKCFKTSTMLNMLIDNGIVWCDLGFYNFDDIITCALIEKMFPTEWRNEVKLPIYREFINGINTKDDEEIAKSILKKFNFVFEYSYNSGTTWSFYGGLLNCLFILDFDFEMADLFVIDSTPSDEMNDYLYELSERNEVLDVNKALRKKSFINLLKSSGIVAILNDFYKKVLQEVAETGND